MSASLSLPTVDELWSRLDQMENELRFQGKPYPSGMCKFPFHLRGQGFFPGGDGLWRDSEDLSQPKQGLLPRDGAVFIGNDFGTLSSYLKLRDKGFENVPTWRHIKIRIENAEIPKEKTFFTNAILGLRENGTALGKRSWMAMRTFAEFCGDFLRFQLDILSPRLVVVMGPDAQLAFDAFGKQHCTCPLIYTTHPYGDFGLSPKRRSEESQILATAWANSICW
jgi:hypothetical protein